MTFYDALTIAMDERGMEMPELCEKTGFYASYFSKLKSGHIKDVTWQKALVICDALGITPDQLMEIQLRDTHE